jgi:hypothetical protein
MDGELQRVPQTITGAQWNDLQVHGVPLPALCPAPELVPLDDVSAVTDTGPAFEALQSSKVDDTTPDMAAVTDSMAVPIVMLPVVASASSGMDGFVNTSLVLVVDALGNLWSWGSDHLAFVQLVAGVALVALLVAMGMR